MKLCVMLSKFSVIAFDPSTEERKPIAMTKLKDSVVSLRYALS